MKRLENTCTDFKRAKYIRRGCSLCREFVGDKESFSVISCPNSWIFIQQKSTLCLDDIWARPVSQDHGYHYRRDTPPNQTSKGTNKGTTGNTQLMRAASSLLVIIAVLGWLANSVHIMKPFRNCRVQFVSDAFAFVSDCQCVLLPRSPGMCLSTWAMRNLKRLESTRLVTDTKSSRQLKKNCLACQNWVSEFYKRTYRGCRIKKQKLN